MRITDETKAGPAQRLKNPARKNEKNQLAADDYFLRAGI